jgi:hypothetical protein
MGVGCKLQEAGNEDTLPLCSKGDKADEPELGQQGALLPADLPSQLPTLAAFQHCTLQCVFRCSFLGASQDRDMSVGTPSVCVTDGAQTHGVLNRV